AAVLEGSTGVWKLSDEVVSTGVESAELSHAESNKAVEAQPTPTATAAAGTSVPRPSLGLCGINAEDMEMKTAFCSGDFGTTAAQPLPVSAAAAVSAGAGAPWPVAGPDINIMNRMDVEEEHR